MLTEIGRFGELGSYVHFRDVDTEELLWKAPMQILPRPDDLVGQLKGQAEVVTWYKVETVKWIFDHAYGDYLDEQGQPQPHVAEREYFGVCILVSEVV